MIFSFINIKKHDSDDKKCVITHFSDTAVVLQQYIATSSVGCTKIYMDAFGRITAGCDASYNERCS